MGLCWLHALEGADHVADVGRRGELRLARIFRNRNIQLLGDSLEQRHRLRRLLLRQEVDLQIELRTALALPGEVVLADQDKIDRKIASRDTISVRNAKGNGSTGRQPGTSPVFQTIQPANQTTWTAANHPVPAIRATASEKRSDADSRARSAASSCATAATFRASSGDGAP